MQITLDNTKCYLLPISIQRLLHSTIIQRTHRPHNITRHPNIPLFFYFTISSIRVGQQTARILSQNTFGHEISDNIFPSRPNLKLAHSLLRLERERDRDRETHRFRWIDSHMIYNLLVRGKSNE